MGWGFACSSWRLVGEFQESRGERCSRSADSQPETELCKASGFCPVKSAKQNWKCQDLDLLSTPGLSFQKHTQLSADTACCHGSVNNKIRGSKDGCPELSHGEHARQALCLCPQGRLIYWILMKDQTLMTLTILLKLHIEVMALFLSWRNMCCDHTEHSIKPPITVKTWCSLL